LNLTKVVLLNITFLLSLHCSGKQLIIAAEDSVPPFSDKNGQGISINIINAVFKQSPYKVKYISVPYARALKMLTLGQVDGAFHVTKDVNNKDVFLFGIEPLLTLNSHFFYSTNSTINYSSLKEIPDGTSVAVMLGFEYGNDYLKHKDRFKIIQVNSQKQIIKLLLANRITMGIMYKSIALQKLTEMSLAKESIRQGHFNSSSDSFLVFNKNDQTSVGLVNYFDLELKRLKQSGEYQQILSQQVQ